MIDIAKFAQPLHLPLAVEAGEAGLAGEELLHGGLFEVALLGDEPVQPAQQRIHIAQRRRDGALFVSAVAAGSRTRRDVLSSKIVLCVCADQRCTSISRWHAKSRVAAKNVAVQHS